MLNIQVEVEGAAPVTDAQALTAIRVLRRVLRKNPDRVVCRVKLRALFGLVRPSFAIRLRHFTPALAWLAAAAGVPLEAPELEETPE